MEISQNSINFSPREYQVELLEKALKKNIIVCLGTGSGKTFIAVMLIKELKYEVETPFKQGGKRTFFLAKTVPLVTQQATVLRQQTGLNVGHYFGSMNVDTWDKDVWMCELTKNEVMVMTTQILVNMLNMGFISLSQINLLIFDECHHAVGGDPVVQVMKNFGRFVEKDHPKVMGLTASILNNKCKAVQIKKKIKNLEITLHSVIEIPNNTAMAASFTTKPTEDFILYDDIDCLNRVNDFVKKIEEELEKFPKPEGKKKRFLEEDEDIENDQNFDDDDDDDDFKCVIGPKIKLRRLMNDLKYITQELGLWSSYVIAKQIITEVNKSDQDLSEEDETFSGSVVDFLGQLVKQYENDFQNETVEDKEMIILFSSPKVLKLLDILKQHKTEHPSPLEPTLQSEKNFLEELCEHDPTQMKNIMSSFPKDKAFRAIIFVERRCTAWMINKMIQQLKEKDETYDFIYSEFVVGHHANPASINFAHMKSAKQQEKILKFRLGESNLLVATRIVEEGMDIPSCNIVIRFDEPKCFRSYLQSKGRARCKVNSHFIVMCPKSTSIKLRETLFTYRQTENALQELCQERTPPTEEEIAEFYESKIQPHYTKDISGPVVNMYNAIQLVNRYCSMLPKDKFTRLTPRIRFQKVHSRFLNIQDEDSDDSDLFDDFDDLSSIIKKETCQFRCFLWLPSNSSVRGVTKGEAMKTVKLAKMSVSVEVCKILHEKGELTDDLLPVAKDYSEFTKSLITIEEETAATAATPQIGSNKRRQLYAKLIANELKMTASPNVSFHMHRIRLTPSGSIPEINYKQEFGLFTREKLPPIYPFPIHSKSGKFWVQIQDGVFVDGISEDIIEKICTFQKVLFTEILGIQPFPMEFNPFESAQMLFVLPLKNDGTNEAQNYIVDMDIVLGFKKCNNDQMSEEKRKSFSFNEMFFTDAVIAPLHDDNRRDLYSVEAVLFNMSPKDFFPNATFKSYEDYYLQKYGVRIQQSQQPLLKVRPITDGLNMLNVKIQKSKSTEAEEKAVSNAPLLIPELCKVLPMKASLMRQAQCLPSILYRLNDLLLCRKLLDNIDEGTKEFINLAEHTLHAKRSTIEQQFRDKAVTQEPTWDEEYKKEKLKDNYFVNLTEQTPSPSVILNALITRAANDCVNLERLEILGDSFLKYSATLYLLHKLPDADEGKLTIGRSKLVSNSHLYQLAKQKQLSNILKVEIFSPQMNWLPPGFVAEKLAEEKLRNARIPFRFWKYLADEEITRLSEDELWSLIKEKTAKQSRKEIGNLQPDENVYNQALYQLISDKSVADGVEAIIGAYLLHAGPEWALRFMKWIGMKIFPENEDGKPAKLNLPKTAYHNPNKKAGPKFLSGLDAFQEELDYKFKDVSFLLQAFTHPSYSNNTITDCYQRLEFLGDAIIDYLLTWYIFKDEKRFDPGKLTDIRSALVNNITFARLAVKHNFHKHLKYRSPSLFEAIRKFIDLLEREKSCDPRLLFDEEDCLSEEEVEVPKALGDVFESVAGAIYLDSGGDLDILWNVYYKMMKPIIDEYSSNVPKSPIAEVYEMFPDLEFSKATPVGKENSVGGDNTAKFSVSLKIRGKTIKGFGDNSKSAKLNAAKTLLRFLKMNPDKLKELTSVTPVEEKASTLEELFLKT